MSQQNIAVLTLTVTAADTIGYGCFVNADGTLSGAEGSPLGVARFDATSGQALAVDVIGTAVVITGAAIALGAALETNASGRAVTRANGPTVARALQAAGGSGEFIEALLIPG